MSKKKTITSRTEVTIQDVAKALEMAIGFADHAPENEGKEFTFIVADQIFKVMGNPKRVDLSLLPKNKTEFADALQAALVPACLNRQNYCHMHEILEAEDASEDGVWISVRVRINAVLAIADYNGQVSLYRDTGRSVARLSQPAANAKVVS